MANMMAFWVGLGTTYTKLVKEVTFYILASLECCWIELENEILSKDDQTKMDPPPIATLSTGSQANEKKL